MLMFLIAWIAVDFFGVGAKDELCYEIQQLSTSGAEVLRTWEGSNLQSTGSNGIKFIDKETGLQVNLRNCPTIITEIKLDK